MHHAEATQESTARTMAVVCGLQARMVGKTTLRMEKTTGSVHMRTSSSQSCRDSQKSVSENTTGGTRGTHSASVQQQGAASCNYTNVIAMQQVS